MYMSRYLVSALYKILVIPNTDKDITHDIVSKSIPVGNKMQWELIIIFLQIALKWIIVRKVGNIYTPLRFNKFEAINIELCWKSYYNGPNSM